MITKSKSLLFFLILSLLCACGQRGGGRGPASEQSRTLGQIIEGGEELSPREEDMATDICYALKSKRHELNNIFFGSEHKMELTNRQCDGSESSSTIDVKIAGDSQSLYLSPINTETLLRIDEILTDSSDGLSGICETIFNGGTPQNVSNVDSDLVIRTQFFGDGSEITVRLEHASRSFSNTGEVLYTVTHVEDYVMQIDEKFGPLPAGMVRESSYISQCPEDSKAEHVEYEQKLIP